MHVVNRASLALAGLSPRAGAPWGADARRVLEWACGLGYGAVQIDASMPGLRPRELDRSARREVAGMLRRRGALISGIDLLIPPQHFADVSQIDRAAGAVRDALSLAGDWGGAGAMSVSVLLPGSVAAGVVGELAAHAERVGAVLADCAFPANGAPGVRVALDPAVVLMGGGDVSRAVTGAGQPPVSARLSDLGVGGVGRVEVGQGTLDLTAYRVALSVGGYAGVLVVDLRGVRDQAGAAGRSLRAVEGHSV